MPAFAAPMIMNEGQHTAVAWGAAAVDVERGEGIVRHGHSLLDDWLLVCCGEAVGR